MRMGIGALVLWASACGDNVEREIDFPSGRVLYQGGMYGDQLAVIDGHVYFSVFHVGANDEYALLAVPTEGGAPTLVWQGAPNGIQGSGLVHHEGRLFWPGEYGSSQPEQMPVVRSVSTNGGDATTIAQFSSPQAILGGISIDNDRAYAANFHEVISVGTDGTSPRVELTTPASATITWTSAHEGSLYVIANQKLSVVAGSETSVRFDERPVYRGTVYERTIYMTARDAIVEYPLFDQAPRIWPLDGTPVRVVKTPEALYALVEVSSSPYASNQELRRMTEPGGPVEVIASGLQFVDALVADDDALYLAQCSCSAPGFVGRIELP